MFGDIEPDAIVTEGVLVRVKALEVTGATGRAGRLLIHRGILLMAEDDGLTRSTFPGTFAALGALGFLFVACSLDGWSVDVKSRHVEQVRRYTFQFPRTTCQTAGKTKIQLVIRQKWMSEWRGQIYQPVRDRIAKTALFQHGQNQGER